MVLVLLWELLTVCSSREREHDVRLFSDAAALSSMLPAVKLLLVLLQAQEPQVLRHLRSSTSSSSSDTESTTWHYVQLALSTACNLAKSIICGPGQRYALRQEPAVQQLLAAPELQQLMLVTGACLAGMLHQQQQGKAEASPAEVVRALSNTAAAAVYAGSSSSSKLEPYHTKVLELLQVPAADPFRQSDPASIFAKGFLSTFLNGLHLVLRTTLLVTEHCFAASKRAENPFAGLLGTPAGPSSSSSSVCSWQQLAPVLVCMLVGIVQMVPDFKVRQAALERLMSVTVKDSSVWSRYAAAGAVTDVVLQLGPAVLHAVQQQRQQEEQDEKLCEKVLRSWALDLMHGLTAGEAVMQDTDD
jgi:hypothetical protein